MARRKRISRRDWRVLIGVLIVIAAAAAGLSLEDLIAAPAEPAAGTIRVTDGDTFRIGDERIRVENIDTPELGDGAGCASERALADRAKAHAELLLADEDAVTIRRNGEDQYGRTLARVAVDGQDFGALMVAEGLARRWEGRRHEWCG